MICLFAEEGLCLTTFMSLTEEHFKELGIKMGLRITMKQWISQRGRDQHPASNSSIQPLLESEPGRAQILSGSPTQSTSSATTSAPLLVTTLINLTLPQLY